MAKIDFSFEFQSYVANETDMQARINRLSPDDLTIVAGLIDALHEAGIDQSGGKFVAMTIVGHADRYDVQGQTPEQRRAVELANSRARADSDTAFFLSKLGEMQPPFPTGDWKDVPNVSVHTVAAGSANLVILVPATESERLQNRRLEMLVTAVGIVSASLPADGTSVLFA